MNFRRLSILLAPIAAVSLLPAPLFAGTAAGDWPRFRGPRGDGTSPDAAPVTWSGEENLLWKTGLPGMGASSPIVVGGRIYLTASAAPGEEDPKRQVLCLESKDGSVVWTKDVKSKLPEQGKIRENHGYASSTPVSDGERIYAFFGKSGVVAFDLGGKGLWDADVGSGLNGWGSAASPILHRDLLIVNASVESETMVAFDRRTGKEAWRASGIKEAWNTPLVAGVKGGKAELIVPIPRKILGFDPASGEQLWSCDTGIGWYMVPSVVAGEGAVYCIGGRQGGALAVRPGGRGDVTGSHKLWTGSNGSNVTSQVLHEDHLYWMHDNNGIALCADAATGKIVYEKRMDGAGQIYASPVIAGGKIYYVCRDGRTFVVAAKPEFEVLAVNAPIDRGTFNASPAVAGGRLYIRSDKFLYCIGEKEKK
jgi:outer membrane protein assembly factor BamB